MCKVIICKVTYNTYDNTVSQKWIMEELPLLKSLRESVFRMKQQVEESKQAAQDSISGGSIDEVTGVVLQCRPKVLLPPPLYSRFCTSFFFVLFG